MLQPTPQPQKQPQSSSNTPSVATAPTHADISQRAYDIYAESGYQQGQSNQNWVRAEKDLNARGAFARQPHHQGKTSSASADPR